MSTSTQNTSQWPSSSPSLYLGAQGRSRSLLGHLPPFRTFFSPLPNQLFSRFSLFLFVHHEHTPKPQSNVFSILVVPTSASSELPSCEVLQPVPKKMRLDMVIGMQNEILDGHHRSQFKYLIWKETWTLTIEHFDLHSDDHFESHFVGNGLYYCQVLRILTVAK